MALAKRKDLAKANSKNTLQIRQLKQPAIDPEEQLKQPATDTKEQLKAAGN
ncbi:hypothetical protein [Bacteroides sp. 214]|uniref:hypothetical protein n=1 Tax=Bacteroides sp. 214 TaxID=2302935 RepID=UPI0013D511FC|nr:hypothetical protein [Bacteroides sp. 214]